MKTPTVDPRKSPEKSFQYVDVSGVSNTKLEINEATELLGRDAPSRARRVISRGDVIFATVRPTLKRIAVVPEHLDNEVCSTGYFVFQPNDEIYNRYLYYFLQSELFMSEMERLQSGASYPAVNDSQVKATLISYPPISEQKNIVAILDQAFADIDRARELTERNLQNARELFESYLQQVFSQRGEGWCDEKMMDVCLKIQDGAHHSPKQLYPEKGENQFLYITSKNIRNNYMDLSKVHYVDSEFHDSIYPRCTPELGDVLLTKDGANTGNVTQNTLEEPFSLLSSVCLMKTDRSKLNPAFLKYYIQSPMGFENITGQMTGAAIKRIILKTIKASVIPIPPVKTQDIIVENFDKLLGQSQKLEKIYSLKLGALDELKKSLLQKAFSGELTKNITDAA